MKIYNVSRVIRVKSNTATDTKVILADDMKKYVEMILEEYGQYIPEPTKKRLYE